MKKAQVLVVEDERIVAKDIQSSLQKLGYVVPDMVSSGEEAIAKVEKGDPDLVLMDIMLKGNMDGVEAAEQIRSRFNVPVVYLTAHADDYTLQRAKMTESFGYILKPFEEKELHTTIEMALHKHKMERKLEQQVSTILKSIGDGVIAVDREGGVTFMNPVAEALTGWKAEEVLGKSLGEIVIIIEQETGESLERPLAATLEGAVVNAVDLILISREGRKIPIDYRVSPIRDEEDNISGEVLTLRDITQLRGAQDGLKRTAEALGDQTGILKSILDSMGDGVVVAEENGEFLLFNPAAEQITGIGATETTLDEWSQTYGILFPDMVTPVPTDELPFVRAMRGEEVNQEEYFLRNSQVPKGVFVTTTARQLKDEKGNLKGSVAVLHDVTESKKKGEQIQRNLQRLSALRNIDMAITASHDLRVILNVILDQVTTQLRVDTADVLLLNPYTQMLEYAAGRGFRTDAVPYTQIRLGKGHAGRAALERKTVNIPNLLEEAGDLKKAELWTDEGFISYYGAPLIAKGQVKGVLEVFHRAPLDPDREWIDFLETLSGQAAIAIDNAELFEGLQRTNAELTLAYDNTLEGWSRALDLRDKETEGHTQRVTDMTLGLARTMGLGEDEIIHIRRGALLHDIGKMGIPDGILLKDADLTDEERAIMGKHPIYAYEMLSPIDYLHAALAIPYCHHEKWDGTGYPRGLKGDVIPLAARIFAVVDVWDALRSDRPYRKGWPTEKVLEHIQALSGTHFDPQVVDVFLEMAPGEM